jgi:hypothetical protein
MRFALQPYHVARLLGVLFAIPIFWVFAVEGVTTTMDFSLDDGSVSSSSDLGSQIAKVVVFVILVAVCALAERYLKNQSTPWPPAIRQHLIQAGLAPADPPAQPIVEPPVAGPPEGGITQ